MGLSYASRKRAFAGDLTAALLAPVTALLSAELLHSVLDLTRIGVLFLAAVVVVASFRGQRAALLTALVGVVAYTLFLQGRIDEQTTAVEDLMNLAVFIVVALITGALAGKVHDEASKAQQHARSMELLFRTSRTLSEEDEERFWKAITDAVAQSSGGAALALDANGVLRAQSGESGSDPTALAFGRQVLEGETLSIASGGVEWRAQTIPLEKPFAGVLLWKDEEDWDGSEEFVQLVVDLASASIARSRVRQEQSKIEAAREAGKLREALLSSISHDFRSPLAAIIGSSTSLLEYGDKFDEAVRRDLLLNIQDEGEKLNQFVANLLNMTRLQSGVVQPNKEPIRAADIITAAAERLQRHRGQLLQMQVASDCAVLADPLLLEQVVYNILDNAAKYAATAGGVQITCSEDVERTTILIADHGPGLPKDDHSEVFTSFHFARKNGRTSGTGLGLSIARGFVEAMGGFVEARDRSDGGSGLEIAIILPQARA